MSVGSLSWTFNPACLTVYHLEADANLNAAESTKEPKSKEAVGACRQGPPSMAHSVGAEASILPDQGQEYGGSSCIPSPSSGRGLARASPDSLRLWAPPGSLGTALEKLLTQKSDPEQPGRLVTEVAHGNVARVLELVKRHPDKARAPRRAHPRTGPWGESREGRILPEDRESPGRAVDHSGNS